MIDFSNFSDRGIWSLGNYVNKIFARKEFQKAVTSLVRHFVDTNTRALLFDLARRDEDTAARRQAVASLALYFPDTNTRSLLIELARRFENTAARRQAVFSLGERFADTNIRAILVELIQRHEDTSARSRAIASLADRFRDDNTRALLFDLVRRDEDSDARQQAVVSLAMRFRDAPETVDVLKNIIATPLGRTVVERATSSSEESKWGKYLALLLNPKIDSESIRLKK